MDKKIVTDEQELTIRRQASEVVKRVLSGVLSFNFASPRLQAIVMGIESFKSQEKKHDRADDRRRGFKDWYQKLGFVLAVPRPDVSNREMFRRAQINQSLFYRPATKDVSYEAFMQAVGQGAHWTVADEVERTKIGWEPTEHGYWFWAEIHENCPRLGTCWNDLIKVVKLSALEEYVIVWHAHRAVTGKAIDRNNSAWLRTRYDQGALDASGSIGTFVDVCRNDAQHVAVSSGNMGGRSVEKLKKSA